MRRGLPGAGLLCGALAVGMAALSSGCATCKTPPPMYVSLEAGRSANAGASTRVLILQLKSLDILQVSSFNDVRKDPAAALAETMVGQPVELWVNAGETESRWVARDKDTRYVAAVAVYQTPSPQKWWAPHKVKPVGMLQCREVPVESVQSRRPYSSEEQMRFYLDGQEILSGETTAPRPEAEQPPAEGPSSSAPARAGTPARAGA